MGLWNKIFGKPKRRSEGRTPDAAIQERNEQIRADRAAGMSTLDLMEKYGLKKPRIYQITAKVPRPPQTFNRGDAVERNLAMVAAYEKGEMNATELGEKYGISRERVCQVLRPTRVIERAAERRELVRQEMNGLKETARAERDAVLNEGLNLVRQGFSISEAARRVGLTLAVLELACRKAEIESKHGRWRDFQPKIDRVRELRAAGLSWHAIDKQCKAEGLAAVTGNWVARHCPDLVANSKQRTDTTTANVQ